MRNQKSLTSLFWIIACIFSVYFYNKEAHNVIVQFDSIKTANEYLDDKLGWIIDPYAKKQGRAECIMRLNSSRGMPRTEIWVTEGEVDTAQINPMEVWKNLLSGKNAMLVNSPDERFSCATTSDNSLVSKICKGCDQPELTNRIKNPGEVIIGKCNGKYKSNGLFSYVANAIVVNWQYLDSALEVSSIGSANNAQAIWKDNTQRAISNLFREFNTEFTKPDKIGPVPEVMVFTGIGTHFGQVPIGFLYETFFNLLDSNYKTDRILPKKIFINLYRKQIETESSKLYYALRNGFMFINKSLSNLPVKRDKTEWLEIVGLCLGMILFLWTMPFFARNKLINYSQTLINSRSFLISIGHFLLGYGFLKIMEKVPLLDSSLSSFNSPFLYVILGFLSVPLAFFVPYITQQTNKGIGKA